MGTGPDVWPRRFAGRFLEQQRPEPAFGQSQQEHPRQPQQQHRLPSSQRTRPGRLPGTGPEFPSPKGTESAARVTMSPVPESGGAPPARIALCLKQPDSRAGERLFRDFFRKIQAGPAGMQSTNKICRQHRLVILQPMNAALE